MAQTRSDIRREIETTRQDIADRLDELGSRVDDAKARIKHSVDPKYVVRKRPWVSMGVAIATGFATQRLLDGRRRRREYRSSVVRSRGDLVETNRQLRRIGAQLEDLPAQISRHMPPVDEAAYRRAEAQLGARLEAALPANREPAEIDIDVSPWHGMAMAVVNGLTRTLANRALSALAHLAQEHLMGEERHEADEFAGDEAERYPDAPPIVESLELEGELESDEHAIVTPEEARHDGRGPV